MQKMIFQAVVAILAFTLAGCSDYMPNFSGQSSQQANNIATKPIVGSSVDQAGNQTNVNITMTGGGEISLKSMTSEDKNKMSRAMDAATGKSTQWTNSATGVSYTVTPIKKVVIEGNPFCRRYSVLVEQGNYKRDFGGTACVTTDGSWHTI
jgi:surface antigen